MECKVDKPYPKVEVEKPNIEYAKLLFEDYSGDVSELSAITQYVYQKFEKFNVDREFSDTLSEIAMVEMKHLELLGETIKLLGIEPRFIFSDNYGMIKHWNSSFVDYTTNIIDMLLNNIKIEEETIARYQYDINVINDKYIRRTLYRIIEDEEMHIKCFKRLLNKIGFNCLF